MPGYSPGNGDHNFMWNSRPTGPDVHGSSYGEIQFGEFCSLMGCIFFKKCFYHQLLQLKGGRYWLNLEILGFWNTFLFK